MSTLNGSSIEPLGVSFLFIKLMTAFNF